MYDAVVRTTFSPDPDVAAKIKALARISNKSMSQVLNDVLREALCGEPRPAERKRFEVKPFPLGLQPGIDPLRLNQIVDEIEDEKLLRRMATDGNS